ncbi:MAG: response regulator transcription factor [Bryobacterales bacterium]|nr:response regulator transcription factor [Bryobacterales bacterium]MBV9398055.1 response regulator transcription factor [Bryobacterales bacterium]
MEDAARLDPRKPRVVLADDHAIVAAGLEEILKNTANVVASVRDGRALLAAVAQHRPEVVLTDISMPLLNGLDAIKQIKIISPETKTIILTMHSEPDLAVAAFKAGASGYLLKTSEEKELEHAIRDVMAGRTYVTSMVTGDVLGLLMKAKEAAAENGIALSSRQREVLQLIAEGRTMKEVATILNISQRTAESHKYDMMETLGVKTTADLIRYAIKLKLVAG